MSVSVRLTGVDKRYAHGPVRLWPRSRRSEEAPPAALREINLVVQSGESLGIMGANGSGKSTLLKLIQGGLLPSAGEIWAEHPVRTMDLGSAMNREFSGRENLVALGLASGLARETLHDRMEEIIAFSELGSALDQPLRTYSTGMAMRLAFSLNVHTEPRVFLIDEALAVGDARFIRKCTARLREMRQQGTTLLLASHDGNLIRELCDRAILIVDGRIDRDDSPATIVDAYYAELNDPAETDAPAEAPEPIEEEPRPISSLLEHPRPPDARPLHSQEISIEAARLLRNGHPSAGPFSVGDECTIEWLIHAKRPSRHLTSGIHIHTERGAYVFGTSYALLGRPISIDEPGGYVLEMSFRIQLGPGRYVISIGVAEPDPATHYRSGNQLDRYVDAFTLEVEDFALSEGEPVPFFGFVHLPVSAAPPKRAESPDA